MADTKKKKAAPAASRSAANAAPKPKAEPKPRAEPKQPAKPAAEKKPAARKAAAPRPAAGKKPAAAPKAPVAKRAPAATTAPAGKKAPAEKKPRAPRKAAPKPAAAKQAVADGTPGAEGYFVARVRGEDAAREAPHPLTETVGDAPSDPEAQPVEEGLGELPWGYGDDTFMALPRNPRTLFLFWDFSSETSARAFDGLDGARAELRVLARAGSGWEEVRRVDFALESRGYYVHDLEPGRVYRAEIHAVGRGGDRLVGNPTNDMMLPPLGPSPVIDDRFIRIPWDMPLGRLLGPGHAGGPFSDEARSLLARLSDWSRFGVGGGSQGGIGAAMSTRGPGMGSGSGSGMAGSGAGRGP
ncbi:MAG: DUF4912 domain-containing protein [Anaeromyxobacteraceae bacterium]